MRQVGQVAARSALAHRQIPSGTGERQWSVDRHPRDELVGRDAVLARLDDAVERAAAGRRSTVLVAGTAGIGKTSLLHAVATPSPDRIVGWGTCVEGDAAPGYWPWRQALNGLVQAAGTAAVEVAGANAPLLAAVASALGPAEPGEDSPRARLLLLDAAARWLQRMAAEQTVVLVLDDPQWADESSLALLDHLSAGPDARICLLGAYRDDELSPPVADRLAPVAARSDRIQLPNLDHAATLMLVERAGRHDLPPGTADAIYQRAHGHPLFTRELALAASDYDRAAQVPLAVRGAIDGRLRRLATDTRQLLRAAALAGNDLLPDVLASATGLAVVDVERAAREAGDAGVVVALPEGRWRFAHDLFRETLVADLDPAERVALHAALGRALEQRRARGAEVAPAELARHFTGAVTVVGAELAARSVLAAAEADRVALAFGEAAGHLRRLRAAMVTSAVALDDRTFADVLVAEAEMVAKAGRPIDARGLLRTAGEAAARAADPSRTANVALAVAGLGARFAARRDDTIRELEGALAAITGRDDELEAQVRAMLARELQHSVSEDRPRAEPLSEQALELGRRAGDPHTLLVALLARHDVLWTPGRAEERAEIAREMIAVAQRVGDDERWADAQLLLANGLLEQGSAAFQSALEACLSFLERQDQPRHRYTARTRRACVALLHGDLGRAAELIDETAALGERIFEPDTGNVCMSQRLELIRACGNADELRAFAAEAVAHWTGAPVHAAAVNAGFLARAGDLDAAAQHVAAVVDLGTWRADRSYLWSVFVRELAVAAIALDNTELCAQLFADLRPLAGTCGVNGAVIAFAGSHAHVAGNLARALGEPNEAHRLLQQACGIYRRLGAALLTDARRDLDACGGDGPPGAAAVMARHDRVWRIAFAGQEAAVPHSKGLADLAVLVSRPGVDVHVLELTGATDRSVSTGAVVDRQALDAYHQRLRDIDEEAGAAEANYDSGRVGRLAEERELILAELRRVTGLGGDSRQFANHPAERARKAVTARVRDAIRALEPALPDLAAHLDRTIVTGTFCRYRADPALVWTVERGTDSRAPG